MSVINGTVRDAHERHLEALRLENAEIIEANLKEAKTKIIHLEKQLISAKEYAESCNETSVKLIDENKDLKIQIVRQEHLLRKNKNCILEKTEIISRINNSYEETYSDLEIQTNKAEMWRAAFFSMSTAAIIVSAIAWSLY
jgi:chromosome segregation ATPase